MNPTVTTLSFSMLSQAWLHLPLSVKQGDEFSHSVWLQIHTCADVINIVSHRMLHCIKLILNLAF